jgi:multiple sugar transport system permease protein
MNKIKLRDVYKDGFTTLTIAAILCLFLSPILYMVFTSLKTKEQMTAEDSPIWPAQPAVYLYQNQKLDIYDVPTDQGTKAMALLVKGRSESTFIDPAQPGAQPFVFSGSYHSLKRAWEFAPTWDNYVKAWNLINFPRLFYNTLALAVISLIGTLCSCILVAYGFARFRVPGKGFLFTLLISTIFLPAAVTLVPTYTFFVKIGWIGTWLPLLVPTFFANAYDVFLFRQYFLTIPREMDEAAMMDGASPIRILISIILPQSIPVIVAVSVFHIVWAWNDFFSPMIYLSTREDLQPIAVGLNRFNGIHSTQPQLVQAAAMMTVIIPVIIFLLGQRAFMRGVVITGVEK